MVHQPLFSQEHVMMRDLVWCLMLIKGAEALALGISAAAQSALCSCRLHPWAQRRMGLHADAVGLLCCGYRAPGSVWWVLGPPFSTSRAAELSPPASFLSAILKEVKVLP